jgi:arsenate reductase-like glutaredoxin family protein
MVAHCGPVTGLLKAYCSTACIEVIIEKFRNHLGEVMSKRKPLAVSLEPVRREVLTSTEFKKLLQESPELIARSKFVMPTMGKNDFGGFEVQYTIPRLRNLQSA